MNRWALACWLVLALTAAAPAGTFYVAADGKPDNDGSRDRPWPSVELALARAGGGHTVVVRPGVYRGPVRVSRAYAGTREHPTVIRSEVKWGAVILGAPQHAVYTADGCDWCAVEGFEVLGARGDGIKLSGDHDAVRDCWVHHNGCMGVAMHGRRGGVIERNLIEFNGGHPQLHHGVYASGEGLVIRRNVVRHNAAYGLHLYPSVTGSVIALNLVHGHANKAGLILACPAGGGRNVVVNNTIADNAGGVEIWQGDGEVVANNVIVGRGEALWWDGATRSVRADYNLCIPRSPRQGAHGVTGDPLFVDPARGVYWLRPDSPAAGKGGAEYAPDADFWGRPAKKGGPVDLGCFALVPSLAEPQARSRWHLGYAYRFRPGGPQDMPDLWAPPK
ncbi:MAG TPA: right-handed parallel beta-helix repeat-containing protein [Gemmataceae bacterium]|nr:right-handed parallel beta-helix repeat-containing protein [Gemmataceae bacterium]